MTPGSLAALWIFAGTVVVVALVVQIAAWLFRRARIAWLHAFAFGGLVFFLGVARQALIANFATPPDPMVSTTASTIVAVLAGGLFFRGRGESADGIVFDFRRAMQFAGVVTGVFVVIGAVVVAVLGALVH